MTWLRMTLGTLAGAVVGYAYYATIGCTTGHCLISGNPWASSTYFALLGWLLAGGGRVLNRWSRRLDKRPH